MQTILKEIILTNIINNNNNEKYVFYELDGFYKTCFYWNLSSPVTIKHLKNITYEIIKLNPCFAYSIKHMKWDELKELIQSSIAIYYIKNVSNEIKWFALKDNIINVFIINGLTKEMIDFVKKDKRFHIVMTTTYNQNHNITSKIITRHIELKNKNELNDDEMLRYYQCGEIGKLSSKF
jgi:hypothetical protein